MLSQSEVLQFFQSYEFIDRPLVVALSGGVDSVALLLLMAEFRQQRGVTISAIHVHHGLSQNADIWAEYCVSLCEKLGISLGVEKVNILEKSRTSLEQQARDARYQVIAENVAEHSVVLTAHHLGDQAETLLFRLMRGAGSKGLSSMASVSDYPNVLGKSKSLTIARPFINVEKGTLIQFVTDRGVTWIQDESNWDNGFDRNFLRNQVLPLLKQRWSAAEKNIAKSATLLQQEVEVLNEYLTADLELVKEVGFLEFECLNIKNVKQLTGPKRNLIVRLFVHGQTGSYPGQTLLEQINNQIFNAKEDQQPQVKIGKHVICRHRNSMYLITETKHLPLGMDISSGVDVELEGPYFSRLNVSLVNAMDGQLKVKYGNLSAKLRPNSGNVSKTVKQLFKDAGCPVWFRPHMPLIFLDEQLIAVANMFVEHSFRDQIEVKLTNRA